MKACFFFCFFYLLAQNIQAQSSGCTFGPPVTTIHFGAGRNTRDINTGALSNYERVSTSCPTDGYYSYTDYTSDCFGGDWLTLEDHTPGDAEGNMMLVNAAPSSGVFFTTTLQGLKDNTTYQFGVWLMNVCRISDKCPFPLLPNITIQLKTLSGRTLAQLSTGEVPRLHEPHWTQYRGLFTLPAGESIVTVSMADNAPGGCGNDFAMDDITLRECIQPVPVTKAQVKSPVTPKPVSTTKPAVKKVPATTTPPKAAPPVSRVETKTTNIPVNKNAAPERKPPVFAPPPAILVARANPVIKQIETEEGSIKIDLYDNGEIDGDTVSIYHNNELIVSRTRLSQKPISFRIAVDAAHPHHELVMVANNLGAIPPNTSLMIVTTASKKFQVFISSTEQKNAKVVLDLKE